MWYRPRRLVAALVVSTASVLALAPTAPAAFDTAPDPTWMTNGTVYAIARSGNTVYLGGTFTQVRPCPPGVACSGPYKVANVAALDATTGLPIKSFKPFVTGGDAPTVYGLAVLDGKLFIGGRFTDVGGQPRLNFAAVDAVSGAVDPNVDARVGIDATQYVRTLTVSGSRIYAGGAFKVVDGITRTRLAAFDSAGNLDAAWKPRAAALVRSLTPSCDGATIFAGGNFRSASGSTTPLTTRTTLARFDASSGALHPWQITPASIPNGVNAFDLAVTCGRLFVGYGGSNFAHAFDLTDDTGDVLWGLKTGGDVQTIAVYQDMVVFGGHFSQVSDIATGGNARRIRFAAADLDGHLDPWAPSFEGKFFGPWDILTTGNQVWVGGNFTTVSGVAQSMIARFTDTL